MHAHLKGREMSGTQQAHPKEAMPKGRNRLRLLGAILAAAGALVGLTFLLMFLVGVFQPKVASGPVPTPESDAGKYSWTEVRLVRKPRYESAVGTVKAVHEAGVASRLLSRVTEIKVKAGQLVQRDEVLVRLDDIDLKARYLQAEKGLESARHKRDQAVAELNRAKELLPTRAIAVQDYERAATAKETAEAEVSRCEQARNEAEAVRAYATIKSPMTGKVIDKKVEVGDTVTPGQILLTIYNPDKMQMLASVRESLALKLHVGQPIQSRLEALDHKCEATIDEIVPEAQTASRSFVVKVAGPCPPGVYSGMFGRIYIPLEDEDVVLVPASALQRVGQLEMVQVLENDKVRRRGVETGRHFDGDVEVLAGLVPGEKVAIPNDKK